MDGMKINIILFILFWSGSTYGLSVGSKTAVSTQGPIIFPTLDTNNTIVGYAQMESGFSFQDNNTSCSFDCFIPVSGPISLNGGRIILLEDFILSNTFDFKTGGRFYANRHNIRFPKHISNQSLPSSLPDPFSIGWSITDSTSMNSVVNSNDWAYGDNYIAAVSSTAASDKELKIYYFDGSTLTPTQSLEFGKIIYNVRFHPTKNYLLAGAASGTGNELFVCNFNTSNGTLSTIYSENFAGYVASEIWHPSGNYFVVGSPNGGAAEIFSYSFNQISGTVASLANINISGTNNVQRDSITFAPGGNRFSVGIGENLTAGASELLICSFSAASIAITTSVNLDRNVAAADWSPTGSYIATGLNAGSNSLRIYKHTLTPSESLSLVSSALVGESSAVNDLTWSHDGTYIAAGISKGSASSIDIYYFDKTSESLELKASIPTLSDITTVRWSRNDSYVSYGNSGNEVVIIAIKKGFVEPLIFDSAVVELNSKTILNTHVYFIGECIVNGNNKILELGDGSMLIARPGSTVTFQNTKIHGIKNNYLNCMTDDGQITLRNSTIKLESNFTFSRGSLLFEQENIITGTSKLIYSSARASTISSFSKLILSNDITFSYDPRIGKKNLLYMPNSTACLHLNKCSLHSTRTGLLLDRGTLVIDNNVTFSSEAKNSGEALELGSTLELNILGGSILELFGKIKTL